MADWDPARTRSCTREGRGGHGDTGENSIRGHATANLVLQIHDKRHHPRDVKQELSYTLLYKADPADQRVVAYLNHATEVTQVAYYL